MVLFGLHVGGGIAPASPLPVITGSVVMDGGGAFAVDLDEFTGGIVRIPFSIPAARADYGTFSRTGRIVIVQ